MLKIKANCDHFINDPYDDGTDFWHMNTDHKDIESYTGFRLEYDKHSNSIKLIDDGDGINIQIINVNFCPICGKNISLVIT